MFVYEPLGRLSEIQKDGQMQTLYGYDVFENRTWKEESGKRTSYQHNVINQMVSEKHGEILRAYRYDKRGNLTGILENGRGKKQYVHGAINRLEEAVRFMRKPRRIPFSDIEKVEVKDVDNAECYDFILKNKKKLRINMAYTNTHLLEKLVEKRKWISSK